METTEEFNRCADNCVPDACKYGRGEECAMWHDPRMEGQPPAKPYVPCLASEFGRGTCFRLQGHAGCCDFKGGRGGTAGKVHRVPRSVFDVLCRWLPDRVAPDKVDSLNLVDVEIRPE